MVLRAGVVADSRGPRTDFLEFALPLIQPYGERPEGGGAYDDQVALTVVVDIGGLET